MIEITRFKENDIGTWGELFWNGFKCYTFEPAGPDTTERGKDRRIPQKIYNLRWHNSNKKKKKMPHLYNDLVPKDRYILIHNGNFPDHTEGCILLGRTLDKNGVLNSKEVFEKFRTLLLDIYGSESLDIKVDILNDFGR